jgi:predicted lipoprotein with Yx(FWY)xxD motif
MQHPRIIIATIAVAVAAAVSGITIATAAGSSTSSAAGPAATGSVAPGGDAANQATVQTTTATVQGTTETILVDANGLPLYIYKPDTSITSHVSGQLAALWPPLVTATPSAVGVTGRITSVATTNGKQVAYNDHFLYTFVEDRPGHVTGQGVQNFFVATPELGGGAVSDPSSASANSGYSYGY